ncbi:MAG TPA: COX15/CtaA family protein [Chitinophagaceae bacterium]|nr:COX15/CtaA family protein [Chitinophagaceae bacterium]
MTNALPKGQKAVAIWIYIGIGMLLVQVILGGITRLTGSGLSITEWNVLSGKGWLPPMNDQQWQAEFVKYQQTPQYQLVNADFTLSNFKFIYFWEWFHREWAKLIAVVFVVGFVYLLARRYMRAYMIKPLLILFLLGAVQGTIGWIMVLSGLTDDMVYVKPLKLALHFVFALGLICYAWWFALALSVPASSIITNRKTRWQTWSILLILFFQLIYGALMAGHKAAAAAPTWPSINGSWWPSGIFTQAVHLVDNKITVHFMHRGLAYVLLLFTIMWTVNAWPLKNRSALVHKTIWLPASFILLQVLLGILAVKTSPYIVANHWGAFDWIAQLHQVVAMFFLLTMVWMLFMIRNKDSKSFVKAAA